MLNKPISLIFALIAAVTTLSGCYCDEAACPLFGAEIRLELPNLDGKIREGTYLVQASATYDEGSVGADIVSATMVYDAAGELISYEVMRDPVDPEGSVSIEESNDGKWIVITMVRPVNHRGIDGRIAPVSVAVNLTRGTDVLYDEVVEPDIESLEQRSGPSKVGGAICGYCEGSYTELRLP